MTGPAYPRPPLPGSNAIGQFQIGVSPIGDIKPLYFYDTVLSQYANSPILMQLLSDFDSYIDQTKNMNDFFDLIWNVDTAVGYGLDVWGRIVGVSRTLSVINDIFFGFASQSPTVTPFDGSIFFSGASSTDNFDLTDQAYRQLILAKAAYNICDGSTPAINQLMMTLFPGRGDCWVTDNQDMTITYTFAFTPTAVEFAIITQSGVLPKPVGVAASVDIL